MYYRMGEQILPLNSFVWVHSEHPFDHVFGNLGDVVYIAWEAQWLVFYIIYKVNHISRFVWRTTLKQNY